MTSVQPECARTAPEPVHAVVHLADAIVQCNERFSRLVGSDPAALVGKSLLDLCPELQSDGAFSAERWTRRWQAARAGLAQWFPWQFRGSDGRRLHALVHLAIDPEDATRVVANVHDLSNLGQTGWIRPDSRARLQQVLDHTKAIIVVKDLDGRYLFANREFERATRMPADRVIGHTDNELWPPEFVSQFVSHDTEVAATRTSTEYELDTTIGRQRKTFLAFKFPLFELHGEPYAVCAVATDITDRKRTQDALTKAALAVSSAQGATVFQELVRYLAAILEVDGALIATPNADSGACTMHTHAFLLDGEIREDFAYPLAGTPCETVIGHAFRIYPSALRHEFPDDKDFEQLGFESYAGYPLHDAAGKCIGLVSVVSRAPMTNGEFIESILKIFAVRASAELERQHAEETLRRSEASYRAMFEASEDAVFVHDWDTGAIIDVNRRACEIYGYDYESMKNVDVKQLSSGEYPYTWEEAAKKLKAAKAGKPMRFEWRRRNRDGSLHWDEVVLRAATIAGERRILAFTREVTERKLAEQALRQAQKMEALGHLTGGIAHDFNNLLTSIMGYVVLASEHPAATRDAKLQKYLGQAQLSCGRARDLIQQMLTFSRGQRGRPRPVSLGPLVKESLKLFGSSMPSTLDLQTEVDGEVPAVMLDPVHLDQILLNLCLNARDAMSGVGTVRVSVGRAHLQEPVCTACRQTALGEFVELAVEDDGPGIPAEIVDRIFDPFFTTKEVGKGSGMGLASVHGIVHELGGHIVVDTTPGRGTRFSVLFPMLAGTHEGESDSGDAEQRIPLRRLQGHVLVVDDEQAVGAFMRDLLENWGLEVTVATTGVEAASAVTRDTRRFDIVITDQMMPRMTGTQLAREIVRVRPDLPVILYTGFNEGINPGEIEGAGLRAVLKKPIDPHELFGLLQTHLPHAARVSS
ncbi:MAG: PAS domain-containing hybrid sensor histidine kinase/response regulator [Burkholderiales bacterium]